MSGLPAKFYVIVAISHAAGAFAAGLISSLVNESGRMAAGMTALTILFVLVMVFLFTYDFPVWFVITDTVATAILGFLGVVIGSARSVG
jgi:serine protease inhibitor